MGQLIVNGFTVGTEQQQLILSNPTIGSFPVEQLGHQLEFNAKQESTKVICTPSAYNGRRLHRNIYHDWSGMLRTQRFNANMTQLILRIMQIFQDTGAESYFSLFTSINNTVLNTVDQYYFNRIVLDEHDLGKFDGTTGVENSIAFRCQSLTINSSGASGGITTGGPTAPPTGLPSTI